MKNINKKFNKLVKKAKETFPLRKEIHLRVKSEPTNPFNSSIMGKIIEMRETHSEYVFYIHKNYEYIRYTCPSIEFFEPVKLPFDEKLLVEMLCVFDFVEVVKDEN